MKNYQSTSKPGNQLTNMLRKLLHWMSHLELSGGYVGEQDIGQQRPMPAWTGLMNEIKEIKNQTKNILNMKSKYQLLKWLAMLFVLVAGTLGAWAQLPGLPYSGDHSVCLGETKNYGVDVTIGTTYAWTITTIDGGNGALTLGAPPANLISINWTSIGRARLELTETNGNQCSVTVSIVITINPLPVLTLHDPAAACTPGTVDLTAGAVTAGSTLPAGTTLSYWLDAAATQPLANPATVAASGTYYIMATTATTPACTDIAAVNVIINPLPVLTLHDPAAACTPGTVDLTAGAVTAGSTLPAGTTLSYWLDAAATQPLANPATVAASGTYYIMATTATTPACTDIAAVNVIINPIPTTSAIWHD